MMTKCADPVILNLWHPVGAIAEAAPGAVQETVLLEERLSFAVDADGEPVVWRSRPDVQRADHIPPADRLPAISAYGYVWTSLGSPPAELFPIPEYQEPDRRKLNAATFGVNVSAPRAIENFLDMGHFPYVH
ncbi:aromatic ring-hydroxylating dioxygenase subunit alpha, partial [Mesorhizobium sp. M7A.F.Ca.US.001.02.1.1]